MCETLTEADRAEAIYILKRCLKPKQMREVINQDIERPVARTEHSDNRLTSFNNLRFKAEPAGFFKNQVSLRRLFS